MPVNISDIKDSEALKNIHEQLDNTDTSASDANKSLHLANNEISQIRKEFSKLTDILHGVGDSAKKLGGIPIVEHIGSATNTVSKFQQNLIQLDKMGFQGAGKAAQKLSGSLGVVSIAIVTVGKTVWEFHKMLMAARKEMAYATLQMGDTADAASKTGVAFAIAKEAVIKWGANIDDVTKMTTSLISAGLDPTSNRMQYLVGGFLELSAGLQLTESTIKSTVKLLKQEYRVANVNTLNRVAGLVKGYKQLNMTTSDYLNMITSMSRQFLDFGISAETISTKVQSASKDLRLGASQIQRYVSEMMGGPRQAGLGQRAWLAEQMGIGGGNALAGAAMISYSPEVQNTLGTKVIEKGLMDVVGITKEEYKNLDKTQKWAVAEQVAMFSKQFGISERTTMEEFSKLGLVLKKENYTLQKSASEIFRKTSKGVELLGESRNWLEKIHHGIKAIKYAPVSGPSKKGYGVTGIKGHTGLMIEEIPKYHNGGLLPDERMMIGQIGEGVLSKNIGVPTVGGPDGVKAINKGILPTQTNQSTNLNIQVDIPVLQPYIQEAINKALSDHPNLLTFG